jgi:hypothetical protein
MAYHFRQKFSHRLNANGSHDSICTVCYLIVATSKIEAELAQPEWDHACHPVRLYQLSQCL